MHPVLQSQLTALAESDKQARETERARWLQRYISLFGEPPGLAEYRAGTMPFRAFHDTATRIAEQMVAEAGYIRSVAFNDED